MEENRFPRLDKTAFRVLSSFEEADREDKEYWLSKLPRNACIIWNFCGKLIMALQLPPNFKEFLKLLKGNEVRYLLIGG